MCDDRPGEIEECRGYLSTRSGQYLAADYTRIWSLRISVTTVDSVLAWAAFVAFALAVRENAAVAHASLDSL
ncbi:hypothetical protein EXIGLDRAFT_730062 [Exidia glandulosa HHB12029]|uniref:Uncharacterized protein n=1 Tax=Exidia glandulosa HHB12029 TaxID=1314781 RepID=A0A165LCH3_EXIGL|nr:hypothetical protein EXIGLDRAFT_730062 [Exidia glandulosa HHB12029]